MTGTPASRKPAGIRQCGITRLEVLVGIMVLLLLALIVFPSGARISIRGNITKTVSNARQICTALKIYAAEHDGRYPDYMMPEANTSNDVFRELFRAGAIDNEMIFGAPSSASHPDGKLGDAPLFPNALEPGENHWAFTAGLSQEDAGAIPLIWETPMDSSWPPKWNRSKADRSEKGRSWPRSENPARPGGVVLGFSDGRALLYPLEESTRTPASLKELEGPPHPADFDKGPFGGALESKGRTYRVLDVAVP